MICGNAIFCLRLYNTKLCLYGLMSYIFSYVKCLTHYYTLNTIKDALFNVNHLVKCWKLCPESRLVKKCSRNYDKSWVIFRLQLCIKNSRLSYHTIRIIFMKYFFKTTAYKNTKMSFELNLDFFLKVDKSLAEKWWTFIEIYSMFVFW